MCLYYAYLLPRKGVSEWKNCKILKLIGNIYHSLTDGKKGKQDKTDRKFMVLYLNIKI